MSGARPRSRGIRHPVRRAVVYGLLSVAGIALVVAGVLDMRATGRSGSPWWMLGLLPALLAPIAFVHALHVVRMVRAMHGAGAIARWTLSMAEFDRFREEQARIPARSVMVNYYRPPRSIPAEGVEVVFSDKGVLIDGGYFPLSVRRGRRVQGVRLAPSQPAVIEFTLVLKTLVRTSTATVESTRALLHLRVPVAADGMRQAATVVRHYQARIDAG